MIFYIVKTKPNQTQTDGAITSNLISVQLKVPREMARALYILELLFFLIISITFFLIYYLFMYLFMAVLDLRFCARAFSSCGKWGPLFITVHGPLTIAASPVVEHRLQTRRLSSCGSRA